MKLQTCQYKSFQQGCFPLSKTTLLLSIHSSLSLPPSSFIFHRHVWFFFSFPKLDLLKSLKFIHPSNPSTFSSHTLLSSCSMISPILDVFYLQCGDERRFITACGGRFPSSYWSGSLLSAQLPIDRNGKILWLPVRHAFLMKHVKGLDRWWSTDYLNQGTHIWNAIYWERAIQCAGAFFSLLTLKRITSQWSWCFFFLQKKTTAPIQTVNPAIYCWSLLTVILFLNVATLFRL